MLFCFAKATNTVSIPQSPHFCNGITGWELRGEMERKSCSADAGCVGAPAGYSTIPAPGFLQRVTKGRLPLSVLRRGSLSHEEEPSWVRTINHRRLVICTGSPDGYADPFHMDCNRAFINVVFPVSICAHLWAHHELPRPHGAQAEPALPLPASSTAVAPWHQEERRGCECSLPLALELAQSILHIF